MRVRTTIRLMLSAYCLLPTAYCLLLLAVGQEPARTRANAAPQPAISLPAPDFDLPTPDGRIIRLSQQRGKVVVLEFLQTTCPTCQAAGEALQRLYDDSADHGLQVIGISHDRAGMEAIREYQFQHRLTYPVVLGDLEVAEHYVGASRDKPSFEVPFFIFINRRGRVVETRSRENPKDREWFEQLPGSLEATVARLLGPPENKEGKEKKEGQEKKGDSPEKAKGKTQKAKVKSQKTPPLELHFLLFAL